MFESDRVRKEARFRDALGAARDLGDKDLEFVALAYLGASLVHSERNEEGMMLLDEALAAVAGSDVDDFRVLEEIFCQLFSACEYSHDVTRADQWIRIGEAIAERRKLPSVSAFCRTHYGGLLTAAGRWPEADAALTAAVRPRGLGQSSLRGSALARLAAMDCPTRRSPSGCTPAARPSNTTSATSFPSSVSAVGARPRPTAPDRNQGINRDFPDSFTIASCHRDLTAEAGAETGR